MAYRIKRSLIWFILLFFFFAFSLGRFLYLKNKPSSIIPYRSPTPQTQNRPKIEIKEFYISIPKINVSAPIIPNIDGSNEEIYLKALENGVAHFLNTALPGEGGNIFIFGHSSYYLHKPGNYKTIFKNLNKLEKGDEIDIILNGKKYDYYVNEKKIIKPNQVEYLNQTNYEQLSLMTCYPPGSIKYRLIVLARPKR